MEQARPGALLESDDIQHLLVIYHDYSGRSCAKTVARERFAHVIRRGTVFARANLSFTLQDHQAIGATFLADTGDFMAIPDLDSSARVPYLPATARVHTFMRDEDGAPWEGCPRTRLEQMVARYQERGLSVRVGMEAEYTLFRRSPDGDYAPADSDGMFTLRGLDRYAQLLHDVVDTLRAMDVVVDQLGKEYGPGQYEMTSISGAPVKAADDYLTIKEVVRALARRSDLIASYMPKPFAHLPGNGLHVHMSLWDQAGERDLSCGETPDQPLSPLGRQFVAGLLAHAPALAGIGASTVNSYKRLLPGSWAPAHICWGIGNRAALVRVPGMGARRRVEFRAGDNACNPFIYLTALLAAGMDGIERELEPPPPVTDDIGHLSDEGAAARNLGYIPRTLPDALDALEQDSVIMAALGPVIAPELLKVRRTELAAYEQHVHPWERAAYLETL